MRENFGEAKTADVGWMLPEKQFCDRKTHRIQQKNGIGLAVCGTV